jgi:hypothetical protein
MFACCAIAVCRAATRGRFSEAGERRAVEQVEAGTSSNRARDGGSNTRQVTAARQTPTCRTTISLQRADQSRSDKRRSVLGNGLETEGN